jgi:hypothetical protein
MSDGELERVAADSAELTEEARSALMAEIQKRGLSLELSDPFPPPAPPTEPASEHWTTVKRFANLTEAARSKEALDAAGIECQLTNMAGLDWFVANIVGGVKLMVKPENILDAQEVLDEGVTDRDPDLQNWSTLKRFRDLPEAILAKGALDSAGIECHITDDNMVRLDWFISNLLGGVKLVVKPEDRDVAEEILDQPTPEQIEYDEGQAFSQPTCPKCGSFEVTFENALKGVALAGLYMASLPIPVESRRWSCSDCGNRWTEDKQETHS